MRGQKRPLNEKARAVGIAVVAGGAEASRRTGIPQQTIHDWLQEEEFVELRKRTKEQVAEEWWAGVQRGFRAVIREFEGNAPLQQKATAAAILFDKLAMVRGEATIRSEVTEFRDYNDHERRELSAAIDALLEGPAGERATEDSATVR